LAICDHYTAQPMPKGERHLRKRLRSTGSWGSGAAGNRAAGGTGERVAREPLTGRVSRERGQVVGSGPVGERATPTPGQDPQPLQQG